MYCMMTMNRRGRLDVVAESRSIFHGYKPQGPGPEGRALRYKVSLLVASAVALLRRLDPYFQPRSSAARRS